MQASFCICMNAIFTSAVPNINLSHSQEVEMLSLLFCAVCLLAAIATLGTWGSLGSLGHSHSLTSYS